MASFRPLSTSEAALAPGYTHIGSITSEDLTSTVAVTAQTITLATLNAGDVMQRVFWYLRRPFEDVSDNAFISTTVSVGDTAGVATHLAAAEVMLLGTEIIYRVGNTAVLYTAASSFTVTVLPVTAAKKGIDIDRGELIVIAGISRLKELGDGQSLPKYNK